MSTAEMLDQGARFAAAGAYFDSLSDQGQPPLPNHVNTVLEAVDDPIYGPVVASNLEHLSQQDIDPQIVVQAVGGLSALTGASSADYERNAEVTRPRGWMDSDDFKTSLENVQREMTVGGIALLPNQYSMTRREGRGQVERADKLLTDLGPEVGRDLSDANYSLYFSNRTMSGGAELPDNIDDVVESTSEEQMPHLTRTNLAIGQIVQGVAERNQGRLTIIDSGSGTGATLAAIIGGLGETEFDGSLHGVESNSDFWQILQNFSGPALEKLLQTNFGFTLESSTDTESLGTPQTFGLINGELSETFSQINNLPDGKTDTAVVTANFVWHRLPRVVKQAMIDQIAQTSPNSIFLIADLVDNGSAVNRRYFNFGNNGPLNTGNVGLQELFESKGYVVHDLAHDTAPTSIHPKLVERIQKEANNDGRLWIAYKGDEAERLLAA